MRYPLTRKAKRPYSIRMNNTTTPATAANIVEAAKLVDMHVASEREKLEAAAASIRNLNDEQLRAIRSQAGIETHLLAYRERLCSSILGVRENAKPKRRIRRDGRG